MLLVCLAAAARLSQPSVAAPADILCQGARWPVKTLTDPDAASVVRPARKTWVLALNQAARPADLKTTTGRLAPELVTFVVSARLGEARIMGDGDIHLVIKGLTTSATMVVELPDPRCSETADPAEAARMAGARAALERVCGRISYLPVNLVGRAEITGVFFFDFVNGAAGQAANEAELHPVTGFRLQSARCSRSVR
ncbi:MAG: hypothetical protein ACJ76I_14405 [Gaiellaceae bacterium]